MGRLWFPLVAGLLALLWARTAPAQQCCGDCSGDGAVTIDEIITAVNNGLNGCVQPSRPLDVTILSPQYNALLGEDSIVTLSATAADTSSPTTYTWGGKYRFGPNAFAGFLLISGGEPTITWTPGDVPCPGLVFTVSVAATSLDGRYGDASVEVYVECSTRSGSSN